MKTIRSLLKNGTIGLAVVSVCACNDLTARLPAGSVDPKLYNTPEAVEQMAKNVRYEFQIALLDFILDAGMISDELYDSDSTQRTFGVFNDVVILNQRHFPDVTLQTTSLSNEISKIRSYSKLQRIRGISSLAEQAIREHAPALPRALRGEMLAYEAFSEIMLADLYCSGIPLSTIDLNADYSYRPGTGTLGVYEHAVALLDSALGLAQSDPQVLSFARVAKGRALLALGRYEEAQSTVQNVPTDFRFSLPIIRVRSFPVKSNPTGYDWMNEDRLRKVVANRKGTNGMPFLSVEDPRVVVTSVRGSTLRIPAVRTELVVTNGIEARLIEAEAKAQAGDTTFLRTLNTLRTDGTFTIGALGDTVYGAGTGSVSGLKPIEDPGSGVSDQMQQLNARVDLIMTERAYWLFFSGRRQGDLRRLLRHYGRKIEDVYPTGSVPGGIGVFDDYVDIPIPSNERYNPYFRGCLSRGE